MRKFLCIAIVIIFSLTGLYSQDTIPPQSDTIIVASTTVVDSAVQITAPVAPLTEPKPEKNQKEPRVYRLKPAVDIPYTAVAAGWSLYAFTKIYSKDPSTIEEINSLNISDIPAFDRWAADVYWDKADYMSNFFFYSGMPLPVLLMFDKKIRKDAGQIVFLYLETMSTCGIFYTGSTYFIDRYRPLAYNGAAVPEADRLSGNAKNSFIAGHVALVATSSFFTAKVFADYNPHSKLRHIFYTIAGVSTVATAYLRHRGGKHFPSDILAGTTVGVLTGILIPHWHKNPAFKDRNLSIMPFTGQSHGLLVRYKL